MRMLRMVGMAALLAPALFLTGCNDDDDDAQPQQNIAQIVTNDPNFSILEAAVNKAGLASALSSGTLTVFAPNNAAFQAVGLTASDVEQLTQAEAAAVLQYHVLGTRVASSDIMNGVNMPQTTLGNGTVYITKNSSGVSVNGSQVVTADVSASNGVIHVIDRVLLPPGGNVVETVLADPNFTYLVAAVQRASQGSSNVAQTLSGAGPFTVFAPINQAFIDAGFPTIESINAADPNTLAAILTYHVAPIRAFSTNLAAGPVATAQGDNVTISLNNGVQVTGAGNGGTAANVIFPNVTATNGVIHVIDRVLLPD